MIIEKLANSSNATQVSLTADEALELAAELVNKVRLAKKDIYTTVSIVGTTPTTGNKGTYAKLVFELLPDGQES